jgi:DNA-binding HxlR family transcriptional regulator
MTRYSGQMCLNYQYAVEILAKRWTALIVKVLLAGPLRFSELAGQLEVVSDRVLSERLKELEQEEIVKRQVLAETPVRVEYSLTEKGQALAPVLAAIEEWSYKWIELDPAMVAASGGHPVEAACD